MKVETLCWWLDYYLSISRVKTRKCLILIYFLISNFWINKKKEKKKLFQKRLNFWLLILDWHSKNENYYIGRRRERLMVRAALAIHKQRAPLHSHSTSFELREYHAQRLSMELPELKVTPTEFLRQSHFYIFLIYLLRTRILGAHFERQFFWNRILHNRLGAFIN